MNKAYLNKVEKKVKELLNAKPKKKKKVKGFLEQKQQEEPKKITTTIDIVAQYVADIRKKRMELTNGT
tara:strand:+ start:197 stop:400 length:204 start_codon:yes stop_codon:yes gene_type:complete